MKIKKFNILFLFFLGIILLNLSCISEFKIMYKKMLTIDDKNNYIKISYNELNKALKSVKNSPLKAKAFFDYSKIKKITGIPTELEEQQKTIEELNLIIEKNKQGLYAKYTLDLVIKIFSLYIEVLESYPTLDKFKDMQNALNELSSSTNTTPATEDKNNKNKKLLKLLLKDLLSDNKIGESLIDKLDINDNDSFSLLKEISQELINQNYTPKKGNDKHELNPSGDNFKNITREQIKNNKKMQKEILVVLESNMYSIIKAIEDAK